MRGNVAKFPICMIHSAAYRPCGDLLVNTRISSRMTGAARTRYMRSLV